MRAGSTPSIETLTGAETGLVNIFTFPGLVFIIAIYSYPYLFVFVSAALETVSSEMEDAANILGAGTVAHDRTVTLPLVLPAILGGAIITFLEAIALFGSPAMIAIPARYNVVTTQMLEFFSYPVRVEVAEAYALPLLAVTVALYGLQQRLIGRRGHVTMTGKGGERRLIRLGALALGRCFAFCLFVSALSVLLPLVVLAQAAFARSWNRGLALDNLTLRQFPLRPVRAAGDRAIDAQYVRLRRRRGDARARTGARDRLHRAAPAGAVRRRAELPLPRAVRGAGHRAGDRLLRRLRVAARSALYGTAAIMILAFTTRFLPIAYANSAAAVRGINPEMEEAVRILGGGRLRAIRDVVAPLIRRSLIGAWLLVFIPATRELSTAIFLYGPNTRVMSVMLLNLADEGSLEAAAALGLLMLAAILAHCARRLCPDGPRLHGPQERVTA